MMRLTGCGAVVHSTSVTTPSVFTAFVILHRTKSPTCTDYLQFFKAKTNLITFWKVDLYHPVALNQGDKAEHTRVVAPPQADTHRIDHNQVTDLH